MFAVPYEYYEKYGVRKYGFHGTSHRYVSAKMAELMGKPIEELKDHHLPHRQRLIYYSR